MDNRLAGAAILIIIVVHLIAWTRLLIPIHDMLEIIKDTNVQIVMLLQEIEIDVESLARREIGEFHYQIDVVSHGPLVLPQEISLPDKMQRYTE